MPFNHQIFDPSNKVTISSGLVKADELREVFVRAFQPMYFPIPLVDTLKNLKFVEFAREALADGETVIYECSW